MVRFWSKSAPVPDARAQQMLAVERIHLVMHLCPGGKIGSANKNFHDVLGYEDGTLAGRAFMDLLRPEDRKAPWLDEIMAPMKRGEDAYRVTPLLSASGEEKWLSISYCQLPGETGNHLLVGRDVTAQHLRSRDNRGQVDAARRSMAVIEFDLKGNILDANDNFLKTLGYRLEEIVGKHHRMFLPTAETSTEAYRTFWARLGAGASETGEVRRISKSGDVLWLEATYETLRDGDGRPFKVVKYAFDVTAAKNAAADARSQIEAIQKVQAVIEFTPDGTIQRANDLFCRAMGYAEDEIIGGHHSMFLSAEEAASDAYKAFWRELAGGKEASGDYLRIGKGGGVSTSGPVTIRFTTPPAE